MNKFLFSLVLIFLITLSSCRQNQYAVNVNDIELDLSITRIEKTLFGNDPSQLLENLEQLKVSHKKFMEIFGLVINIGDLNSETWSEDILRFVTDKQNVEVYESVNELYPNIDIFDSKLEEAWKHYAYYFNEAEVPDVYTCITGFNNSIVVGNSILGISLDRYLGEESEYYPMLGIYNYQRKSMIPEKIVSDCMYAWASSTWMIEENQDRGNNLMETMIHEGKLLYFTKAMMPEESDSLIFGFSGPQLMFASNNEGQMWEYIIEHDFLFSTDPMIILKLTREAPFTSYFTSESPGKAANWIGFRIVESFMAKNPEIKLGELMERNDYQGILELSKYSPR